MRRGGPTLPRYRVPATVPATRQPKNLLAALMLAVGALVTLLLLMQGRFVELTHSHGAGKARVLPGMAGTHGVREAILDYHFPDGDSDVAGPFLGKHVVSLGSFPGHVGALGVAVLPGEGTGMDLMAVWAAPATTDAAAPMPVPASRHLSGDQGDDFYPASSGIVPVPAESLEATVRGAPGPMLVEFFHPQCPHCVAFRDDFQSVARELRGSVRVASVDCMAGGPACLEQGIRSFPTLRLYRLTGGDGGAVQHDTFEGARQVDGIVTWVRSLQAAGEAEADVPTPPRPPEATGTDMTGTDATAAGTLAAETKAPEDSAQAPATAQATEVAVVPLVDPTVASTPTAAPDGPENCGMGRSSYDGPTSLSWATYRDGRWLVKDGPVPGLGEEGATLRSETPVLCSNATADDPFVSMMFAVTRVGPQGPQVVAIAAQVYHPGSKTWSLPKIAFGSLRRKAEDMGVRVSSCMWELSDRMVAFGAATLTQVGKVDDCITCYDEVAQPSPTPCDAAEGCAGSPTPMATSRPTPDTSKIVVSYAPIARAKQDGARDAETIARGLSFRREAVYVGKAAVENPVTMPYSAMLGGHGGGAGPLWASLLASRAEAGNADFSARPVEESGSCFTWLFRPSPDSSEEPGSAQVDLGCPSRILAGLLTNRHNVIAAYLHPHRAQQVHVAALDRERANAEHCKKVSDRWCYNWLRTNNLAQLEELQKRLEEEAKVEGQQFAGNQVLGLALGRALSRYGVRDWVEDAVVLEEWTQDSTPQLGRPAVAVDTVGVVHATYLASVYGRWELRHAVAYDPQL